MSTDLAEFVRPVPEDKESFVVPAKAKQKKKSKDEELEEMRKRAKSYCNSFEQWNSIRKYKKPRLVEWLEQKEFDIDNSLKNSVFSFVQEAYGFILDKISKGEGYVQQQICNDLTLRQALEDEGRNLLKYLSNKSKILVLTGADLYHGKQEQKLYTPASDHPGQTPVHDDLREEGEREDSPVGEAVEGQESMEEQIRPDRDHEPDIHASTDMGDDEAGRSDGVPELFYSCSTTVDD